MVPLSQLEQLLKQFQPNLDITKALASLAQPQEITPLSPTAQPTPATPVVGAEEAADEWFDAEAGVGTPAAEQEVEEVYSGATEVIGEGNDEELGDDEGSKPVNMEAQPVPMKEQLVNVEERDMEQKVDQQIPVEETAEGGLDREGEKEVQMPVDEGKVDDVIELTDEEEENKEEPRKEVEEPEKEDVVGRSEGQSENVSGESMRRRRLLMEEEPMDEEEEQVFFQPIEEIQPEGEMPSPR